jgi:hypothetical protein
MAFSEYPKAMSHPGFRPAILSKDEFVNGKVIKAAPGQPAKFPPVYVNNQDQEAYYSAQGYVPNGTADPEAYHAAMAGMDTVPAHSHVEFPKYLYQKVSDAAREDDIWVADVLVRGVLLKDEAAQERLVGNWYATPGDAAEAEDEEPMSESEETAESAQDQSSAGRKRRG